MKYQSSPGFEACFSLIFTLSGFIFLVAGLHPDVAWSGQRPQPYILIPICSLFIFSGLIPCLFRRNVEIDESKQKLISYIQIIKKFNLKEISFNDISSFEIVKNFKEGKKSFELLVFSNEGREQSIIKVYSHLLALFLKQTIEAKVFKNNQTKELEPVPPSQKAIEIYREGANTYIELPTLGLLNQPLFWLATLPIAGFAFISTLFMRTLNSSPPPFFYLVFFFPLIFVLVLLILRFCIKTKFIFDHRKLQIIKSFSIFKRSVELNLDEIDGFSSIENKKQKRLLLQKNIYPLSVFAQMKEVQCGYFKNEEDAKYVLYLLKSKKQA